MVLKVRMWAFPKMARPTPRLIWLLAKALRIPASAVRIEAGASGRLKALHLDGDTGILAAGLARCRGSGMRTLCVELSKPRCRRAPLQSCTSDRGRATASSGLRSAATPQIISMAKTMSPEPSR
jgi:hypothetical protein